MKENMSMLLIGVMLTLASLIVHENLVSDYWRKQYDILKVERQSLAICESPCPAGYTDTGEYCRKNKP